MQSGRIPQSLRWRGIDEEHMIKFAPNRRKFDFALKQITAKLAGAQAKKDTYVEHKYKEVQQKQYTFEQRNCHVS